MKKVKCGKTGKDKNLTTLIYIHKITLAGIPLGDYEYVANGKPTLNWIADASV